MPKPPAEFSPFDDEEVDGVGFKDGGGDARVRCGGRAIRRRRRRRECSLMNFSACGRRGDGVCDSKCEYRGLSTALAPVEMTKFVQGRG